MFHVAIFRVERKRLNQISEFSAPSYDTEFQNSTANGNNADFTTAVSTVQKNKKHGANITCSPKISLPNMNTGHTVLAVTERADGCHFGKDTSKHTTHRCLQTVREKKPSICKLSPLHIFKSCILINNREYRILHQIST
jgi:hypothetical protein